MATPEGVHEAYPRHWDDWRQHEPVVIASPLAGQGFTRRVPGSVVQRVVSVSFVLTNGGAAANRIPRVEFLDANGGVFAAVAAPFLTVANIAARFTFAIGVQQFGANSAAQIGCALPDYMLGDGLAVRVAVAGVQAADQISGAALFVDQWPVRD